MDIPMVFRRYPSLVLRTSLIFSHAAFQLLRKPNLNNPGHPHLKAVSLILRKFRIL